MHELALIQSVVEMVSEHAQGRCVRRVKLEIGKFTCVAPDAMRFCFDVVATGTPLDGARLEIVEIEALARCRGCGETFVQQTLWSYCPCGERDYARLSGHELQVKEYELDADATV
ncbi:MAG: hydrogenase maturation nickel metallochaperone HypA [Methylocella sp.]